MKITETPYKKFDLCLPHPLNAVGNSACVCIVEAGYCGVTCNRCDTYITSIYTGGNRISLSTLPIERQLKINHIFITRLVEDENVLEVLCPKCVPMALIEEVAPII